MNGDAHGSVMDECGCGGACRETLGTAPLPADHPLRVYQAQMARHRANLERLARCPDDPAAPAWRLGASVALGRAAYALGDLRRLRTPGTTRDDAKTGGAPR